MEPPSTRANVYSVPPLAMKTEHLAFEQLEINVPDSRSSRDVNTVVVARPGRAVVTETPRRKAEDQTEECEDCESLADHDGHCLTVVFYLNDTQPGT